MRATGWNRARERSGLIGRGILCATALIVAAGNGGCVRRTITITSEPEGALCWLNGREVGRTPVTVDFLYYGEYDVQLTHDGFEPMLTTGQANAPLWDSIPLDLAVEVWPSESHSDVRWHYVLAPRLDDRDALIDRAGELRQRLLDEAPVPPDAATTHPGDDPAAASQPSDAAPASQPQ